MTGSGIHDVLVGEIHVAAGSAQIVANALGSCIAVVLYEPRHRIGGVTHVMLPGEAPPNEQDGERQYRYAQNAIDGLLERLAGAGAERGNLCAMVAGGGNVLGRSDDTICRDNIASVLGILAGKGLYPCAQSLGGTVRRRIRLDVGNGVWYCAEGDGPEMVLWRYDNMAMGTETTEHTAYTERKRAEA